MLEPESAWSVELDPEDDDAEVALDDDGEAFVAFDVEEDETAAEDVEVWAPAAMHAVRTTTAAALAPPVTIRAVWAGWGRRAGMAGSVRRLSQMILGRPGDFAPPPPA